MGTTFKPPVASGGGSVSGTAGIWSVDGSGNLVPATSGTRGVGTSALKAATIFATGFNYSGGTITALDSGSGNTTVLGAYASGIFLRNDSGSNAKIQFDVTAATVTRTITFPNASGTLTLLGNTSTGSGSVVLATSPTIATPTLTTATTNGQRVAVASKTADYTALLTDCVINVDASGGAVAITLPAASSAFASSAGIHYRVKKTDSSGNTVTITRAGSDTIDGATTAVITTQYAAVDVVAISATAWGVY